MPFQFRVVSFVFFYGSSSPRRVRCPHGAHHEIQLNRTAIRRPTESIHPVVAARGNKTEVIPGAVGLYFRRRLFFFLVRQLFSDRSWFLKQQPLQPKYTVERGLVKFSTKKTIKLGTRQ